MRESRGSLTIPILFFRPRTAGPRNQLWEGATVTSLTQAVSVNFPYRPSSRYLIRCKQAFAVFAYAECTDFSLSLVQDQEVTKLLAIWICLGVNVWLYTVMLSGSGSQPAHRTKEDT